MNNYLLWIVGAIIVLAAGYWFFTKAPAAAPTSDQGAAAGTAISRTGSGSFNDLVGLGGSFECTITTNMQGVSSQGIVYIADGEVRGDFSSTVEGQTVSSSMLQTGGFVYTWSNMAPQGFKMAVTGDAGATAPVQGSFDPSVGVSYDCDPWVRDNSKFEVPASVTFMEAPMVQ